MPRRDDFFYKAYWGKFLTSELRTTLTRAQWGIYRDLIDLLHANGGKVPDNPRYLKANLFPDSDADLEAVLTCKHVIRDAGKITHAIVDTDMADLDQAREWGSEMASRRWNRDGSPPSNAGRNATGNAGRKSGRHMRNAHADPHMDTHSTTQPTKGKNSPLRGESSSHRGEEERSGRNGTPGPPRLQGADPGAPPAGERAKRKPPAVDTYAWPYGDPDCPRGKVPGGFGGEGEKVYRDWDPNLDGKYGTQPPPPPDPDGDL